MTTILETTRLRLRKFTLNDTAFVIALLNSPGWLQFIGDRQVRTEAQATEYLLNGPLRSYESYGYGFSLVETKDDGKPVGACGLLQRDNLDFPDIGFAFLPEFAGIGYGYEIARGVLDYAFEKLQLPLIYGICKPTNSYSVKLLKKIGLRFIRDYVMPGQDEPLLLHSLKKEERFEA